MRRNNTYRIALGGVVAAAAVAIMFFGSIIPFATIAVPAIASLAVLYFVIEYGKRTAALVYAVIAILSVLLVPEKEAALLFACFFGFYPIVKSVFECMRSKVLGWALKFAVFNAAIVALYWAMTRLIVVETVLQEFAGYTLWGLAGLLALGNLTFFVYDIALTRLITLYLFRVRAKLYKNDGKGQGGR